MFVGHYGVSFALKRASPATSLGTLFFAVQLLDVLFSVFVLAGLEKLRIVPGFTQYNPYDLYYMPYSHSLAGAALWAMVAAGLALAAGARVSAPWIGVAVFSHFLLDVPMHTPDMPILGNDSTFFPAASRRQRLRVSGACGLSGARSARGLARPSHQRT